MPPLELDFMEYATDALARAAYVASADPHIKLLLNMDGANGAQVFTDRSSVPKTITPNGNVNTATAQKKFGTASAYFDGVGDYLSTPDHADFDWPGDFGLWAYIYVDLAAQYCIASHGAGTEGTSWSWHVLTNGKLNLNTNDANYQSSNAVPANTWTQVGLVRSGTTLKMCIGGVFGYSATHGNDFSNGSAFWIGRRAGASPFDFKGYMDDFFVDKGFARWTSDFTPPASPQELALTAYSEGSIITQGSYSLKGLAQATESLNLVFTKTISPVINLSDKTIVKFDMRASRTGSHIKLGLHDSGGVVTEITPNILAADTWQRPLLDLSGVANSNKDAIDQIILTILNADVGNTFYIDNLFADTMESYLIHRGRDRFRFRGYSLGAGV